MRNTMLAVVAAAVLGAATATGAMARGPGGWGGAGGHGPGGPGPGARTHSTFSGPTGGGNRSMMNGPASGPHNFAASPNHGNFSFNHNHGNFAFNHYHGSWGGHGHHFHGHFYGPGFGLYAYGGDQWWGDDDDYDYGCWVHRRVWTPFGWRWRLIEVC